MILLKLLEVSLTHTGTCMMNGFYILSWSWTPDALSCKRSSNSKLSCRSKQFHKKVLMIIWNKRIILQINEVSFRFHCLFAILIVTTKTPEDFRTLWAESALHETIWSVCTQRNTLRTKRNALGMERNVLRMKRNVLVMERNALRTEHFWGVVVRLRVCSIEVW